MDSPAFFCATCGAANPAEIGTCFACGQNLAVAAIPGVADTHTHSGSLIPGIMLKARYRILEQVGSGGFGAVYKAKDTDARGKLVAIKEINLQGLTPQEVIEATDTFNREITVLSGLNHKELPSLSDHFTDPEHWYLVMDFIDGETLEEFLQQTLRGTLPLEDVLDIGIQLCTVLEYLHSRQPPVIFRDIKPANIMRTLTGHLYLIDFGIARYLKPGQARDTIALGSPGFAAPEQYGKAQTTQKSDIYSLGVTLHTLLTGNDPADNPFRLPALLSMNASLPAELVALLEQMLALNVDQRPESVTVVKQGLQRIAMRQFRASYSMTPAQISTYMPQATTISAKSLKHARGPKASVRKTVMNLVMTSLALLMLVGSCGFGSYFFSNGAFHSMSESQPIGDFPSAHQVMRMPVIGSANSLTLDPALADDTQSSNAVSMLYTGLVSLDDNLRVSPQLAASWAVSADGLSWTFHLRPNLMFSDNTQLTSADVVYSIDRALKPATQSPTSMTYLGLIKDADALHSGRIITIVNDSIFAPDPQTVVILLRKPVPYFATLLAYPCAFVVEKSLLKQYGNKKFTSHLLEGGGAGPFKVSINTPGKEIDFVINVSYYGPLPQLSRVILTFYRSTEDSYQAYLANQLDTTLIPQSLNYDVRARTDLHQLIQLTTHYYTMNYLEKPFDNIHIRQAFALAINKDILLRWSQNSQLPSAYATGHIIPMHFEGFNSSLNGPDGRGTVGDASYAAMLLREGLLEEGWSSPQQLPPITFTYAKGSLLQDNEVKAACTMWLSILGVNVKPNPISASVLRKEIAATANNPHGLQFWASNWSADYPDAQDVTTLQFDKGSPYNTMNYGQNSSPDAAQQQATQQLLEQADNTTDPIVRMQLYQNAEQQLINDVAWLPIYQAYTPILLKSYVLGMYTRQWAALFPPDDWANIYLFSH